MKTVWCWMSALGYLIIASGCGESATTESVELKAPEPASRPTVSIAEGAGEIQDGYTPQGQQIAEGYGMTFSEDALDEQIPALPIFGFANGQPFNARTVVFRSDQQGQWRLEVSDGAFDPVKGRAMGRALKADLQTVGIVLPEKPSAGAQYGKAMAYGGGVFDIKVTPDAESTTTWNTSFAYKLEIEDWSMGPSRLGSCGEPSIGSASGKLFASFKATSPASRVRNSWISGQFTDAAIIYCPE